ncbi:helix-turn-helix transcriptional regulator [Pigmentiphaga sp.]|uniref:helix-turn-helix transcriptional regulator n=1 Tax=Pigmentiphaga sp. TaxID=1977564 RepID=UPI00128C30BB|nr:helix-turn-helix transcriptional regulator [Pigmentiphaga sp.]MPS26981.1 helix-turn-helix transcriptional regulator [Alcaligenaceae bacterium SAGV5]MPS51897.1 helix-turn-helix transcriptional regulator [Alcaligenaceae bacterium SAGV3]MPT57151.1 helix-turn-helix transcriptional regulator [Alcaligenaceae bacterium]
MLDGSGQRLHGRLLGHADLAEAQALVPAWLPLAPSLRAALPVVWTRLLGQSGFNADVIEDLNRPPGQRLVGLGMAIALDGEWRQRLAHSPPPFASAALYAALADGRYQPPSDKELARLSGRGEVAFLVLHYEQVLKDLANPDTVEMLGVAMTRFRQAHAGYRLQHLYQEGLGEQVAYLQSMGFRARTARGQEGVPELYGLSRDEAARLLPGSPVRDAFQFTPPRFGFSAAERRLLRLAVTQLTDEEIGDELGMSLHGVKKLWRSAQQRSLQAMPSLFDGLAGNEADTGARGPEKRRTLLHYLRQHPEELRPYLSPAPDKAVPK